MYQRISHTRLLQPILLGTIANILINYIFDPANPDFIWDEFLVAIMLAIPLTEMNHFIDLKLEKKHDWLHSFKKRLSLHLLMLLGATILAINILGNIYIYLKGDSFYSLKETIIINVAAFIVTVFLTGMSWMTFYYKRWKEAELNLHQSNKRLSDLESDLKESETSIQLSKGSKKIVVPAKEIMSANITHGIVRVQTKMNGSAIYQGSLAELNKQLPNSLFFLANRSTIIHRDAILAFTSSSYGKIAIELKNTTDFLKDITVSRQKAAAFRKWFNTTST